MINNLRHRIGAWIAGRSFNAASSGRRAQGLRDMPSAVSAIHASRATIARRARFLVGNNPLAVSAIDAWTTALIGNGIKPQSKHSDASIKGTLNSRFEAWTDIADADGLTDFYGLQAIMARRMVTDGEAFALLLNTTTGLRIRMLDPEQCDASMNAVLGDGRYIIQGIEFDPDGRRIAYYIRERPDIVTVGATMQAKRIDAADVVHMFRPETPGQVRGLSWLTPAFVRLSDLDTWRDAQLVRQKVASLLTGFIKNMDGSGSPMEGEQDGNTLSGGLEPGMLKYLGYGEDITFSPTAPIGVEVIDFAKMCERDVAVGVGIPVSLLTGDLSEVNFSSIRAGLIEWRARVEALQHAVIAFQFLRPIWARWTALEALSGAISGKAEELLPVSWIPPKKAWVNPKDDVEAELAAINGNLMSRREAVASRGVDIELLDAEIAADKQRADSLGITPVPANQNQPQVAAA